jgi:glutamate-5-semialdehyde dehydrogenase
MSDLVSQAQAARQAARRLATMSAEQKNTTLLAMAQAIEEHATDILAANAEDVAAARSTLSTAMIDRLLLTPSRVAALARDIRAVAQLPDPVGEIYDATVRPNGLRIAKQRVPLGVIGVIYEARPNVTSDIAALCLKSGNACILRGGSEALGSSTAIVAALRHGLEATGAPTDAVQLVTNPDRDIVRHMLRLNGLVDVVIPRGGEGLIRFVVENATVPVIETGAGVCHTYVDRAADPEMAARIVENAKVRRPTICNALDTLLVHREIAPVVLPLIAERWQRAGVEMRCDDEALPVLRGWPCVVPAREEDWGKEFLALIAAIKVVGSLDEALEHIARYGSGHSEAIVTNDPAAAQRFLREVDAAAVYVNASTQFTDGGEFGLGAEVGISTQKLHARGPMGLRELTTYKWIIQGDGHVRAP